MDLGANEWTTFWRVTFPLILPGILAAALLAFSLSIDDFVITNFVSGTTNTFPIWVYGIIRNALPAQINVIGSVVFLSAVGLVAITTLRTGAGGQGLLPRLRLQPGIDCRQSSCARARRRYRYPSAEQRTKLPGGEDLLRSRLP